MVEPTSPESYENPYVAMLVLGPIHSLKLGFIPIL